MATVSYAHAVREKLREWVPVAVRIGMRDEFVAAVREMDDRLRSDPESWGDPVRDYRSLHLTRYYRYGPLLTVDYAVHIDGTPVFVVDVHLTPGTPLYDAAG
jgi:hypothetical protein